MASREGRELREIPRRMTSMVYQWRAGFPSHGADVSKVRRELDAIERLNGQVTAQLTVDWAKSEESAMHSIIFDKSNEDAAYEYRLSVARNMIAAVVVVPQTVEAHEPKRVFIHVPEDDVTETESHYGSVQVVQNDPVRRRLALMGLWNELQAWRRRAHEYDEFSRIVSRIEEDEKKIREAIA